ncbi:hypothetical protein CU103_29445 [Phyllobacterium sophorae]|uniref:Uncharacterized protein n=1 Tax=Phyllobacterium sophorae TaxID=1520277 RepID=A0A2P7AQM6_9HYPH|nr:hypothetical protein CU103_29445 [Phyllobacterium sophorae]
MCSNVIHRGDTYKTPRVLSSLFCSPADLVWREREDDFDWCRCVIDVPLSLNRARPKWKHLEASETYIIED